MKVTTPNGTIYETVEDGVNGDCYTRCKKLDNLIELEAKAENYPFPSRTSLELTSEQAEMLGNRLLELSDEL